MSNEDNIKKLEIAADMWDRECDRFWVRNNIYLVVNAALLVLVSSFSQSAWASAGACICGILFAYLWITTNRSGRYYIRRWEPILIALERGDSVDVFAAVCRRPTKQERRVADMEGTRGVMTMMNIVISALGVIWFILLMYYVTVGLGLIAVE